MTVMRDGKWTNNERKRKRKKRDWNGFERKKTTTLKKERRLRFRQVERDLYGQI